MSAVARCPKCTTELDVTGDVRPGEPVECPVCLTRFVPDRPPARARRARRRDDGDDSDDEDEDLDRPRRRRRHRYEDDPLTPEEAEDRLRGPATWLQITGWGGAALNFLGGIGVAGLGVTLVRNGPPNPQSEEDAIVMIVVGVLGAVFGTPYFAAIGFGAGKMKRLESWGWGMAAAILGIATIALWGPCFPTTWAGMGFGIWAVVVLGKAEVKGSFPGRDDYDEDRR
jgi:hypothetical protein